MTHQEILEKAIEKAIAGGWSGDFGNDFILFDVVDETETSIAWSGPLYRCREMAAAGNLPPNHHFKPRVLPESKDCIFNHDFAKALWGEEYESVKLGLNGLKVEQRYSYPNWQRHLMQMVIADDPIKYLEEHIDV